ncbi:MAG: sulfur carrier protein ThiS [Cyanobacteria bacterium]|nr:sulfur carrier protein ThiS [Cyanobacteriota bacterium]
MQVVVNGEPHTLIEERPSIQSLLASLGYETQSVAVAINNEFVPRNTFSSRLVQPEEVLEILSPMQGG